MTITNEQMEARRKTIGGSDIGAILGENNYKTAYEVWEEKVEGKVVDLSKNKSVVIGNLLEFSLINLYENKFDKMCIRPKETFYHSKYDFLSANLDAYCVNDEYKKIIEIKTASVFNKDEWGPNGSQIVPKHYYAQIAHYMLVTGYKEADIFVGFVDESITNEILCELAWFHEYNYEQWQKDLQLKIPNFSRMVEKMETRVYTFYKDEELEELILSAANEFYNFHMIPWIEHGLKNPPPMDFSNKSFRECIKNKYSLSEGTQIKLSDEYLEIKNNYVSALLHAKNFEKIAQEEKAKILVAMGNNQKALLNDGSYFSRKTVKRKEFTVKESEYIKLEFNRPNGMKGEV